MDPIKEGGGGGLQHSPKTLLHLGLPLLATSSFLGATKNPTDSSGKIKIFHSHP